MTPTGDFHCSLQSTCQKQFKFTEAIHGNDYLQSFYFFLRVQRVHNIIYVASGTSQYR